METLITIGIVIFCIICLVMLFDNKSIDQTEDEVIFTSSFVRGGNLFYPAKLIFTEDKVTYVRNHGFKEWFYTSTTTQTIPYNKLTGVEIQKNIIGCNIKLIGNGVQNIYAMAYSEDQADKIELIVNTILDEYK